jgi:signal transduction histidine kinase/ActR/RegA family two-component response regulator
MGGASALEPWYESTRLLGEAGAVFQSSLDSQAILESLAGLAVPALADACVVYRAEADGLIHAVCRVYAQGSAAERARDLDVHHPMRSDEPSPIARVLRSGTPELFEHINDRDLVGAGVHARRVKLLRAMGVRSAMVVPITARTGVLAAMAFMCADSGRRYGRVQLDLALELARQARLPIENAQLFEAERRARQSAEAAAAEAAQAVERTARLQELTAALGTAVTPEEASRVVAALGRATLGAASAFVWHLSADGTSLELAASEGDGGTPIECGPRVDIARRLPLCDALRVRAPVLLTTPEARLEKYPATGDGAGSGFQAWAAIPLAVGGRLAGGLTLAFAEPRSFSFDDERLMLTLAQQCAQAVERTRLFAAERVARERAERAVQQTRRLQSVTTQLSRTLPPGKVAQIVCEEGARALGSSRMAIWVLDPPFGRLSLLGSRGYAPEVVERHRRVPLVARAPLTEAVLEGKRIWLESRDHFALCFPEAESGSRELYPLSDRSLACLPLVAEDRILGGLSVAFPHAGALDEEERSFLLVLAHHCAQALDRHRLLSDVRSAEEAARSADRRKDEFLAMLGHELRNPLAPILTAVELMKLESESVCAVEREVIERQARHLLRLVDDLLDIARITRGRVELRKSRVEVSAVVARAVEMASPLFEKRQHRLNVHVPSQGLVVKADEARLAQVLQNLLTNAAKSTPEGGHVELWAGQEGDDVVIRVHDDGVGIPAELLSSIFEPFVQGERTLDRSEGGIGIGLPLVRNLVEMHGGRVSVASEGEGRGSVFTVRLPGAQGVVHVDTTPPPAMPAPSGPGLRVLVVDDNPDVAAMLSTLLRKHGHDVIIGHDGPAALEAALASEPQVALLDIGLPVMNGYEVAEQLRAQLGARMPLLVAVTGYGQDLDRRRSLRAGFEAHLVKPVEASVLLEVLERLAPRTSVTLGRA